MHMIAAMIRAGALLTLVATLVLTAGTSGSASSARTPDVTALFTQARATVRGQPELARAEVLEADGLPAGKATVRSAAKIVRWRFVFQNATPGSDFASATLTYRHGEFGRVAGQTEPVLEDVVIKEAPSMTLRGAVDLLRHAGYRDGFTAVTLRSPLGPKSIPPLYIFDTADGFVGVNTKNGKVKVLG